jgi:hypothetical protein
MKHIQIYENYKVGIIPTGDENPVSLYNADEQKIIGIFKSRAIAGKFMFGPGKDKQSFNQRIVSAVSRRGSIKAINNRLGCRVAPRNPSPEQKELLGDKEYLVLDDRYQEFTKDLPSEQYTDNQTFFANPRSQRKPDRTPEEIEFDNFVFPEYAEELEKKEKAREVYRRMKDSE